MPLMPIYLNLLLQRNSPCCTVSPHKFSRFAEVLSPLPGLEKEMVAFVNPRLAPWATFWPPLPRLYWECGIFWERLSVFPCVVAHLVKLGAFMSLVIDVKRIYDGVGADDGYRVLVDRLWPRGVAKEKAALDEWLPMLAPSDDLRKWFAHDRMKWAEFKQRYFAELNEASDESEEVCAALIGLRGAAKRGRVTLLFAASETECNNAVALAEYLSRTKGRAKAARK